MSVHHATARLTAFAFASALLLPAAAFADEPPPPRAADATQTPPATADATSATPAPEHPDIDYDDEPPLDWPQRQWSWYTRHVMPQRFAGRDSRTNYGTNPPFAPYTYPYPRRDYFGYGYGYDNPGYGYGGYDPADAYIQGRYDERRFQDWKESHDKGKSAYLDAMTEGVNLFRETRYSEAVGAFVRAAELNQGDPAARLHAAYALVAIGNYTDAVLMIRRAIQLQSRLLYLPLSIREEYGPQVDFDAHLRRLREAAERQQSDPGLWMLVGYYEYFSSNPAAATAALTKASDLAPRDRLIEDLLRASRLLTPSNPAAPSTTTSAQSSPAPTPKARQE